MKKLIIVLTSLILILIFSCSDKRIGNSTDSNSTIEGRIVKVGNEPFTKLAIQINDTTIYLLDCKDELADSLSNKQGEMYKVYFNKKIETELGTKVIVTNVEKIK